jgi:diguanylate cyclase (GGDEF)-like protein/PAS domain S-box-containing protein
MKPSGQNYPGNISDRTPTKLGGIRSPYLTALIIFLLIALGLISSWVALVKADLAMRQDLLKQAEMVAQAIDVRQVKALSGSEMDLENPDYLRLKEQLANVTSVNEKSRFIYLMSRSPNDEIFFLVDDEPPDSDDYSAPGDPYDEASEELFNAFVTGDSVVEGPVIDQWGVWISALVPIIDPETGTVIALMGIDYDAVTWRKDVATRAAVTVIMIMSFFLILSLMVVLLQNRAIIKSGQAELIKLKEFNESIVQNADEGIVVCDQSGTVEFINPALTSMLGYSASELIGKSWLVFVPENKRDIALEADAKRAEGIVERYDIELEHKNGNPVPVQISASPRYDNLTGKFAGSLAVMTDISNLQKAEKAIRESEEKYRLIFERAPLGVLHYDSSGVITDCNDLFVQIIGSSHEALIGLDMLKLPDQNIVKAVKSSLRGEIATYEDYYHSVTANKVTPVRALFAPIRSTDNSFGKAEGGIGIIEDITKRKAAEEKIRHISFHDNLTDLYNRHYLEEEIKRIDTVRQLPISIIMADLNGLKLVNDTYGHLVGDQLLRRAADIIRENSRGEDIVARWGGDEFVILLPQTAKDKADLISQRISASCESVYVKDFPLSIALGAATKEEMTKSLFETLKEAEDKMYELKLTESRSTKSAVLGALLKTLAAKSYETETHTRNMQEIAIKIGRQLNLPDSEINRLFLLITLHDIGKINIPEELLTKKSALTDEEWEIMKKHSETGYRIAIATEEFAHVAKDILCHHEHFDGTGYPQGLKGDDIPLLARITTVADAYEVMNNGRPYKEAMTPAAIIAEFKKCAGTHFDPELVKILLKTLKQ